MSPVWLPDGSWIAFSATVEEGDAQTGLYLLECDNGRAHRLGSADLQVADPDSVQWSSDAQSLFFTWADRGRHHAVRIAVADGALDVLAGGHRQLGSFVRDERCPKCQSEELFVSLMRAGDTQAELVRYPGEDHHFLGVGSPSVRQDAAERIVAWLSHHAQRAPALLPQQADTAVSQPQGGGS